MNVKLKICGMRYSANIAEVAALQPEYMGFIFYKQSPRYVGDDFDLPALPESIKKVGVFVNERTECILDKVAQYNLDFVQLHGHEPVDQLVRLAPKVKVIKVFSVDYTFDFDTVQAYKENTEYFLFDTKGEYYGGNSKVFDWNILRKYNQEVPFFLSGGITLQNITEIKNMGEMNIHAIDVNSGVESAAAVKDVQKIIGIKQAINLLSI